MRPIIKKNFLDKGVYDLLYHNCTNLQDKTFDEGDGTYKLKRVIFEDGLSLLLHKMVMKLVKPHVYDTFSYQFMQYPYTMRASFVYRDKNSDFDPNYHSDMMGGKFNGAFMNAIIYLNRDDEWEGGEFGYKDYELDCMIKTEDNMCIVIPAGMRHKIFPTTKGIRKTINLEFKITL